MVGTHLRVEDLPTRDHEAMRAGGSGAPAVELELSLERLKFATSKDAPEPEVPRTWEQAVSDAIVVLKNAPPTGAADRRKWFKRSGTIIRATSLLSVEGAVLVVAGAPLAFAVPLQATGVLGAIVLGFHDIAETIRNP